jgi:hypothetical protein
VGRLWWVGGGESGWGGWFIRWCRVMPGVCGFPGMRVGCCSIVGGRCRVSGSGRMTCGWSTPMVRDCGT